VAMFSAQRQLTRMEGLALGDKLQMYLRRDGLNFEDCEIGPTGRDVVPMICAP
jgi:hypothetical protein